MILGRIEDTSTAAQKAGRLAGIIGQCPQYNGTLHFWTDEQTSRRIRMHNEKVDISNTLSGYSAIQSITRAKNKVNGDKDKVNGDPVIDKNKYRVYDNETVVKKVCRILEYEYRATQNNSQGFKETSLNRKKEVVSLTNAISKVPTAYGTNNGVKTWRTYYPCYVDITNNETLRFVVIIRPDTDIDMVKREVDANYPSIQI